MRSGPGIVRSAHDLSDGGLAVALAECCMAGDIGLESADDALERLLTRDGCRVDALLFGESQSRILLSLARRTCPSWRGSRRRASVPLAVLGAVGGDRLKLGSLVDLPCRRCGRYGRKRSARC